ncbi:MAG: polysaccharide biosynthesis tyrosine autokinase [Alphaproteobacteria bacterium]|nr:polysaccharide biosynthesis tyrosine autokinase [Alphaproteobacteria bacterium]MBV9373103.1 polysaccharide biosynthesis tyrosine autokinase [Alphaproteobacteria bacterium]MBV9902867.1 polysaccharide biosynthesis tyrosine autokinase [Alphaproteobacteria bacterium]
MSKNDIEPAGAQPIWPLAPQHGGALALPQEWGPRPTGSAMPDLNLATLWRIVSEWRWLILGAVAVGVAGAIVITFLTPPLYRASATLEMNPPTVEVMDPTKGTRAMVGSNDRDFLATQYGLLASRSLAQRVAQDLNLASNRDLVSPELDRGTRLKVATGIVAGNFTVKPIEGSRLVKISFVSTSPTLAAQITNSYADNFINSNLERRYEASAYARQFLERQIAKMKQELENSERALNAYAQSQQIIRTASGDESRGNDAASLEGASLVSLNAALAQAQSRRIDAEQKYRNEARVATSDVTGSTAGMRAQLATLEAEYQEKLTTFRPEYPDMIRLKSRITALQGEIRREAGTVSGSRAATLLAEYQAAAAAERMLQGRVATLKSQVLGQRGKSIQYNILQREADTNRSLYDALLQRYKEIGIAGGVGTNTVSVVDRAEVPGGPYKPNLMLNLLIGLGLGLIGGIGAALALEFLNDTIKTPEDVRDKLQLPSLGVIPKKKGNDALSEELKDQSSPISEAYYSLRTSLQFTTETGAPKSLLITSTRAAEGKSSTTLALAQNFARLGNSVLLIDGDLRKPAFVTGVEPDEGLSKLLTNVEPLAKHVLKTQFENLSLLPCGPLPPNPAELLASTRLKAILAEAMQQFDMVIVDGPPVLGLADAPLLAGVCRASLLVVESGKTRTRAATDAIGRLKASGGNIVGAVLTKFHQRAHGYGYGYGYGYEPYRYGGVGSRDREIKLIAQREA